MPKFQSIIQSLTNKAITSQIHIKLAAVLIKGKRMVSQPYCNTLRNKCKGFTCGSLHAETNAILHYYGNKLSYHKKDGWYFDETKERNSKSKNLDLFVLRINRTDQNLNICNSRPCFNCLNLMKVVGINKVHYTDDNGNIITEHVKSMVSIQASSTTIYMYQLKTKFTISLTDYFNNLIRTQFPAKIKKENLEYFVKYNLCNILPTYKHIISPNGRVVIQDGFNKIIVASILIM